MLLFILLVLACVSIAYAIICRFFNPRPLSLSNAHVMITGGSSGIGRAVAIEAVKQGAHVTIIARNKTKLEEAREELKKYTINSNQRVSSKSVDITKDYDLLQTAINQAEAELGPVEVLVNCAGYAEASTFQDTTPEQFQNMLNLNFLGTVYTTKCVIKSMKEQLRGQIVMVSSMAGQIGLFGYTAYASSKFALNGLAQSLHMEMKPYNVMVSVVYPPDTDTPGLAAENISKPEETKLISEAAGVYQPEQVAQTIIEGAKKRKFNISLGIDGLMLTSVNAGMSPVTHLSDAVIQVLSMGIFRLIGLFYIFTFDSIVKKCMKK
ncbi:unnamed protein product [Owenia fusiformis]|uniref:3-dehydrosphinganine reductase n=1 Tax=Owenia fusiformis TaxID=6347 RepID=A0A8J1UR32_OWEFU|nr:unnamed protein product [Owenia fusiformis]